jgi:3',5'-cyclic AMP phosphodiesterase CpdA
VRERSLAHLSDLHLGRSPETELRARALKAALEGGRVDHVVVTGDITHRGRKAELERFFQLFGGLIERGQLTAVPGNHDCLGDHVAPRLQRGGRVEATTTQGLYLVRVDSTGPHNRFLLAGHGDIDEDVIERVTLALDAAPRGHLVAVLVHHHPLPLPEESFPERLSARLGWPYAAELRQGRALLGRVLGRCDLVLHGHRHIPRDQVVPHTRRPLHVVNAGSSTELGAFRVFRHRAGALSAPPAWWLATSAEPERAATRAVGGA